MRFSVMSFVSFSFVILLHVYAVWHMWERRQTWRSGWWEMAAQGGWQGKRWSQSFPFFLVMILFFHECCLSCSMRFFFSKVDERRRIGREENERLFLPSLMCCEWLVTQILFERTPFPLKQSDKVSHEIADLRFSWLFRFSLSIEYRQWSGSGDPLVTLRHPFESNAVCACVSECIRVFDFSFVRFFHEMPPFLTVREHDGIRGGEMRS